MVEFTMSQFIFTQLSLILEYCSNGNLRSYLIKNALKFVKNKNETNAITKNEISGTSPIEETGLHSPQMLMVWAWQVTMSYLFVTFINIL